jgi:hypothetical protein
LDTTSVTWRAPARVFCAWRFGDFDAAGVEEQSAYFPLSRSRIDWYRTVPLRNSPPEDTMRRSGRGRRCCADIGIGSLFGSRNCGTCFRTARTVDRLTTPLSNGGTFLFRGTVISQRQPWQQYRYFESHTSDVIGVISLINPTSDRPESRKHRSTHLVSFPRQGTVEHSPHHQKSASTDIAELKQKGFRPHP